MGRGTVMLSRTKPKPDNGNKVSQGLCPYIYIYIYIYIYRGGGEGGTPARMFVFVLVV